MSKWECIVCGWVYDEAIGDPDNGVPAGTKWEDVPESWLCPDCGVGKEDFELIEGSAPAPAAPHHEEHNLQHPVVIIGTGLAGYNLAKEFRKHDQSTPLLMITADDGRLYSKPMLSTGYTKNTSADDLNQGDASTMARNLDASIWTFTRVTRIDTAQKKLHIGDGKVVDYSKLVLAWGADTIKAPLEGDGQELVYSINDLLDYDDFRKAMANLGAKKVVTIGAGLIGCEFANDLLNGGFEVESIDPLGWCLPTLLPEQAGKAVRSALEEKGARFHFGALATGVWKKPGGGVRVTLNNGEELHADVVVSAIGVRPRTELAKESGIAVNRGVVVNRQLETSAKDVYALGDCAEVEGNVLFYVAPLMAGARALGQTLAGKPATVSYPAMPVTIKTPACPVVVSPPPRGAAGEWKIQASGHDVVAEFHNPQGELIGFALTGAGTNEKLRLQKLLPPIMP